MDYSYTTLMSKEEKQKEIEDMNYKNNAQKIVFAFFTGCVLWFGYNILKLILILI